MEAAKETSSEGRAVGLGGSVKRVSNRLGSGNGNPRCSLQVKEELLHQLISWLSHWEQPNWDKPLLSQLYVQGMGCCPLTARPPILVLITGEQHQADAFHTGPKAPFPLAWLEDAWWQWQPHARPPVALPSCSGLGNPRGGTLGGGDDAEICSVPVGSLAHVLASAGAGSSRAGGTEQPGTAPAAVPPASRFGNRCSRCCCWGEPPAWDCFGARQHKQPLCSRAWAALALQQWQGREPTVSPVPRAGLWPAPLHSLL